MSSVPISISPALQFALEHAFLIPLIPALSAVIVGFFLRRCDRAAAGVSIAAIAVSCILSLMAAAGVIAGGISVDAPLVQRRAWVQMDELTFTMGVLLDPMSVLMLAIVTGVTLLVEIYSVGYMKGEAGFGRFFAYVSLFSASMLGLTISVNFIQMYIFWELVGLCSYLLIGVYFGRTAAREAAKKAFITTRIGDFGLLVGILMLQTLLGTVDFIELRSVIPSYIAMFGTLSLTVIGALIFIGPVGKSGQFPLHVWLPDAMEGPTPVSALIHAATMVAAGVYLIARAYFLFAPLPELMTFIAWLGGFTALFGAAVALTQREIKRILAYSTISQLGYMMLALGCGALTASLFHLMTHAFFKALLFLCAGVVMHAAGNQADIFKLGGLRKKLPFTCAAAAVGILAIAGIPPFSGFFSKDEILAAASSFSLPLYLIAALTAFMTAFYMARLLLCVFWGEEKYFHKLHLPSRWMTFPLAVLSLLSVVSGMAAYGLGFGEWIYFAAPSASHVDFAIAGSSTVLSLAAFALAWNIYGSQRISSDAIARKAGILYTLSFRKFYIDEFYALVRDVLLDGIGRVMYFIDLYIIDGIVNGLARLTAALSRAAGRLQSGQTQRSAAVFIGGVIILLLYAAYCGSWAEELSVHSFVNLGG